MNETQIRDLFLKNLNLRPTQDQFRFLKQFAAFVNRGEDHVFVLRGYAGTGKTTLVKSIVASLPKLKLKSVLLAPTGRAAKVLANYSGRKASTIHRRIYRQNDRGGGAINFSLVKNKSTNTLFIVDESSMISGAKQSADNLFAGSNLLDDLINYVLDGENCRLLFIGDVAQLPPVGERVSPSLSPNLLRKEFALDAQMTELTEVVRQAKDSGILSNATVQRDRLTSKEQAPLFFPNQKDVLQLGGQELDEELETSFQRAGVEETIVLCRSNKRAYQYNMEIRTRMLFREAELETGDLLMIVKNNYFWLEPTSNAGFIANGDTAEVMKVYSFEEKYGFHFAHCELRFVDYPDEPYLDATLLVDVLSSNGPALSAHDQDKLYNNILLEYQHITNKKMRFLKLKENKYFNALQVKFAYAVTCHKAQGGQWKDVYVDQGYLTEEMLGTEYMRWIYTAITRATEHLYLVNFNPQFIAEQSIV